MITAGTVLSVGFLVAFLLAVSFLAFARWLSARGSLAPLTAWGMAIAGSAYSVAAGLPISMAIARADPLRAPSALLVLLPWAVGAGLFLHLRHRDKMLLSHALAASLLAAAPAAVLGVAGGTLGGTHRNLHQCYGNLKALAGATRDYLADRKTWPSQANWVNELLPLVGQRSAFRCPANPDGAYVYRRPKPGSSKDVPVFECVHPFLAKQVVVRGDLRAAIENLPPEPPPRAAHSPFSQTRH